ncbi:MAG: hypothetical protein M4579_003572, partial [Chaenotheca gracillima]
MEPQLDLEIPRNERFGGNEQVAPVANMTRDTINGAMTSPNVLGKAHARLAEPSEGRDTGENFQAEGDDDETIGKDLEREQRLET